MSTKNFDIGVPGVSYYLKIVFEEMRGWGSYDRKIE